MFLDLNQPRHAHVDARLRTELILWLSTVRPDGRPHLVPVWFLWDGMTIDIFSHPATQKLRNLAAHPAATVALEAAQDGRDIAIIEGMAQVIEGDEARRVLPAYWTKYERTFIARGYTPDAVLSGYSTLIRVTPERLLAW